MGFLEDRDLSNVPSIPEFYKGKTVFITGGTGFMGKILVEKLLYSCTDVDKIYLLVRSKKGVNPVERLKNMYSLPCFDRLRKERPGVYESKVFVLVGDVCKIGLGLSKEDRELIIKKVNIVFHSAASVRFDDSLQFAANMNIRSAVEIVKIAKEIQKLDVLVHVSTAYANFHWIPTEETIYPAYADWRDTLKICEELDQETVNAVTTKYLGDIPNTYIFTKQLAEHVMYEQKGQLPIIITRPSLVISSVSEPIPGWIESFNGPVAPILGVGTGVLRCVYFHYDVLGDYIPVDTAIRHLITAAWIRGTKKLEPADDIPVYNCCSNKKITNVEALEFGKEYCWKVPFTSLLWTIDCTITSHKYYYYFMVLFCHILPALFVDTLLKIKGKKPMLLKIHRRIFSLNIIAHQLMKERSFFVNNFNSLRECLKEADLHDFYYDFRKLGTRENFIESLWGCKRYVLKEKDEDLPRARLTMRVIYWTDKIIRFAVYSLIFWKIAKSDFVIKWYQSLF